MRPRRRCECTDPGCRVHKGSSGCGRQVFILLFRVDMKDETGTAMCEPCSEDATESGLFTEE